MPASQHPRRREVPRPSTRPTASARSDAIVYLGMSPASRAATMPTTVPIRVPGRIASSAHARAGSCRCRPQDRVRLPSAGRGARRWRHTPTGRRRQRPQRRPVPIAMPMQPRFPVNDRTRGTATAETPGSIPASFSRSVPPIQAGVGVVRLKTAGERAPQGSVLVQSDGRRGHGNRSSIRQPK